MNFRNYLQYLEEYVTEVHEVPPENLCWYIDKSITILDIALDIEGKLVYKKINYEDFERFCKDRFEGVFAAQKTFHHHNLQ